MARKSDNIGPWEARGRTEPGKAGTVRVRTAAAAAAGALVGLTLAGWGCGGGRTAGTVRSAPADPPAPGRAQPARPAAGRPAAQRPTAARPAVARPAAVRPAAVRPAPARPVPRFIPKTRIPDTRRNRAVLAAVERYRQAMLAGNIKAITAMVHPEYHSTAGTPQPEDDLDHDRLVRVLRKRLSYVKVAKYSISVVRLRWTSPTVAELEVHIRGVFAMRIPGGRTRAHRFADHTKMELVLHKGKWLFVRGM